MEERDKHTIASVLQATNERDFCYGISGATARSPCVPFLFRVTQTSGKQTRGSLFLERGLERRKKSRKKRAHQMHQGRAMGS